MTKLTVSIKGPTASGKTKLLKEIQKFLSEKYEVSALTEKASLEGFSEQFEVDFKMGDSHD